MVSTVISTLPQWFPSEDMCSDAPKMTLAPISTRVAFERSSSASRFDQSLLATKTGNGSDVSGPHRASILRHRVPCNWGCLSQNRSSPCRPSMHHGVLGFIAILWSCGEHTCATAILLSDGAHYCERLLCGLVFIFAQHVIRDGTYNRSVCEVDRCLQCEVVDGHSVPVWRDIGGINEMMEKVASTSATIAGDNITTVTMSIQMRAG